MGVRVYELWLTGLSTSAHTPIERFAVLHYQTAIFIMTPQLSKSQTSYKNLQNKPSKPLKILTIDGGGLQAIATLTILDKLLDTIAKSNGVRDEGPRPCDVFDCIAGIGAGGWLALLLGRFQLDIRACLQEWCNITNYIAPKSKPEELRRRIFEKCYFPTGRLVEQIEEMTEIYGTGRNLMYESGDVRCRHVFVAALSTNSKGQNSGYNLFRTYKYPPGANVRPGPENPDTYKISRAFAVTGAAKYFTPSWKEQMEQGVTAKFSNDSVKKIHNISELALEEMWGLYGRNVPISVIINIGPGIPNTVDIKHIAKRFSWTLDPAKKQEHPKRTRSPATQDSGPNRKRVALAQKTENETNEGSGEASRHPRVQFFQDTSKQEGPETTAPTPEKLAEKDPKGPLARGATFNSELDKDIERKLKREEGEIEDDINAKLREYYPVNTPPYFRLAPENSPPGTTRNDALQKDRTSDATQRYLEIQSTELIMEEASQRLRSDYSVAVC
jgi:hypothetical protein